MRDRNVAGELQGVNYRQAQVIGLSGIDARLILGETPTLMLDNNHSAFLFNGTTSWRELDYLSARRHKTNYMAQARVCSEASLSEVGTQFATSLSQRRIERRASFMNRILSIHSCLVMRMPKSRGLRWKTSSFGHNIQ